MDRKTKKFIALDQRYGAQNYAPLPVVLERGRGIFVWDVSGKRYFDMLSAYSALNQGHNHPKIIAAAKAQMARLSLTSRAFYNVRLGTFLEKLCRLTHMDKALCMNSGAEAVETAIKVMRLWGYRVKNIPSDRAEIIVARDNFHGRTTAIVSFSSDPDSYRDFGPLSPGFRTIPYDDAQALEAAITGNTCAFLVEPIQGEAGVRIPHVGYLRQVREICSRRNVLLCVDEIQTGLGRTGRMFCVDHEGVRPDLILLGKALSGGLYPVSAVASRKGILDLFQPGMHGSTFGGNPLACAIGAAAIDVIVRERLPQKAATLGAYFLDKLKTLRHSELREIRGKGLLLAVEFQKPLAKDYCKILMKKGLLAKDAHQSTVRFAPPLIIEKKQIDAAFALIQEALQEL